MESRHNTWDALRQHGLLAQILHYTLTVVFIRGIQVLLTPLITRLLPPAEYGLSTIFLQSVNLIAAVSVWGLNTSLSQVYLRRHDEFADTLKSSLLFILVACIVVAPLVPFVVGELAGFFGLPTTLLYFAFPVGAALGLSLLHNAFLAAAKRSLGVTRLSILNVTAAGLLFVALLWWGERTYLARVYSYTVIVVVLLLLALREFWPHLRGAHVSWPRLRFALRYGIPTIFASVSFTVFTYADRVLLTRYRTTEEMGLYSFVCVIGLLPLLLSGSILVAFTPHLYRRLNEGDAAGVKYLSHRLSWAVAGGCLLVTLFARPLAVLLADPTYHLAVSVIPILVVYSFAFYTMSYSAIYLMYHEATTAVSLTWLVAVLLNVFLNLQFIPRYGYVAAAWTTLTAGVLQAVLVVLVARLRYGVRTTGALLNLVLLALGCAALVVWSRVGG